MSRNVPTSYPKRLSDEALANHLVVLTPLAGPVKCFTRVPPLITSSGRLNRAAAQREIARIATEICANELDERPRLLIAEVERLAPLVHLRLLGREDILDLVGGCACAVDFDEVQAAIDRGAYGGVPFQGRTR